MTMVEQREELETLARDLVRIESETLQEMRLASLSSCLTGLIQTISTIR